MRTWVSVLAVAALMVTPSGVRSAQESIFAACERQLPRMPETPGPEQQEAIRCFYEAALGAGATEDGYARLSELAQERPALGWPSFYLASLRWEEPDDADPLLEEAIRRFVRAGDLRGESLARGNRQQTLFALGRIDAAGEEAELSARAAERLGDPTVIASGRIALARHLLSQSTDLERVRDLLSDVLEDLPPDAPYSLRRNAVANLARAAAEIGRRHEARTAFRQLLDLASEQSDTSTEAVAWYGLARIAGEEMAEVPSAAARERTLDLASRALAAAERNPTVASRAHLILGVLGEPGARRSHLQRCAEVAPTPRDGSYCFNALARLELKANPAEARALVQQAQALADAARDPLSTAFAEREQMRLAWEVRAADGAIQESWQSLERIERLRDLQPEGSDVQASLFSRWSDDYSWLGGRILEEAGESLGLPDAASQAFAVAERMRARALTDWLREAGEVAAGAESAESPGLEQVQAALEPREALLSFQVAPWEDLAGDFGGGSWLLAVTREAVTVHRLPGRVEVRRGVQLLDGLIERRDGAERRVAERLYEQLLAPALAELPEDVDRLILVPDDALHRLPFAALRPSPDGEPLGASHELVQVPSATLWLQWREARASAPGRPLLVLADPDSPLAGEAAATPVVAQARAQVRDAVGSLGRLPHARREGRAAVRALGDGLLLVGAEASEARLGELPLGDFGLLHFAAHAVTDEDRPERSAVLLTPGGGSDGLLQSAEIAGLDLAGRTVLLASCRSASGSVLRGEGVMSLARAFFQAGAHSVVASLWPLRDDESEALFGRVYRHLGRGSSLGEALHGARREAIEAGEPAAAWAGLVVLGDGSVAPVPAGRERPSLLTAGRQALWVLLGVVLLGALAAAWRLRSRPA